MKKLLAVMAAVCLSVQAFAGVTLTSTMTTEASGSTPAQSMTTKAAFEGTSARIDFEKSSSPAMVAGTFMLTKDAGASMLLFNPQDKTYMDMKEMMAMGAAMGGMMKISTPKVEKLLDEAGPKMMGYPTRHYKFRMTYTIDMSIMKTPVTHEEEVWVTEAFSDAALKAWSKAMVPNMGGDFQKLIEAMANRYKGLPLKSIVTQTNQAGGKAQTSTTTTLITDIKEGKVPASTFAIPAGYTKQEMPDMSGMKGMPEMPEMPAGMQMGE